MGLLSTEVEVLLRNNVKWFEDKGYKFYSLNTLDRNYNNDATQIILNPDNNTRIGYVVKV